MLSDIEMASQSKSKLWVRLSLCQTTIESKPGMIKTKTRIPFWPLKTMGQPLKIVLWF